MIWRLCEPPHARLVQLMDSDIHATRSPSGSRVTNDNCYCCAFHLSTTVKRNGIWLRLVSNMGRATSQLDRNLYSSSSCIQKYICSYKMVGNSSSIPHSKGEYSSSASKKKHFVGIPVISEFTFSPPYSKPKTYPVTTLAHMLSFI